MEPHDMPVTAKLSRKFYETFGDDIANELVGWFNDVDLTFKTELRELNNLNFQRFDAKLEQRLVEQESRWSARFVALEASIDRRFAESDKRWEQRFAMLERNVDERFATLERDIGARFATLERNLETGLATVERSIDARFAKHDRHWGEEVVGLGTRISALDAKLDLQVSELRREIADQKAGLHRWLFMYWAGTVVPLAGLILALHSSW